MTDLRAPDTPTATTADSRGGRAPLTGDGVDASQFSERYRWAALSVVLVGTLMVVLDTTIVNVALPSIADSLHSGNNIEWVVTAYLLAVAVSQPLTAWMADRYGRNVVFLSSLGAFTVASACAGLAPTLPALIGFRVLQGLGGGAMMPVGMAIVFEVFPAERRGQAMGIWGLAAMAGPAIGPTLGGYLVTSVSWHWLFLVNVPVGAVGVALGITLLRDSGYRDVRRLDGTGLALGAVGLVALLLGVSEAPNWGWGSGRTLAAIVIGVVLLGLFVLHELRTREPIVELRLFRVPAFGIAMLVVTCTVAAQYCRLVFIPLELEGLRDYSALKVGVLLVPSALATAIAMPIGGRVVDRVGARVPVVFGLSCMTVGAFLLGQIDAGTTIPTIVAFLSIQGFGMGFTAAPATVAGLNALPGRYVAQASALRSLNSQVSGAVAISALATLVASRMGSDPSVAHAHAAYGWAFHASTCMLLLALVFAFRLPHVRRAEREARASGHVTAALLAE